MPRITLLLALAGSLLAVTPALAADPAPRTCGLTASKTYLVRVDAASTCTFGTATYKAMVVYDSGPGFVSAVSKNFTLNVSSAGHTITLDCRANARAHGQFDFACNNLNRGGTRVVKLDNQTLP